MAAPRAPLAALGVHHRFDMPACASQTAVAAAHASASFAEALPISNRCFEDSVDRGSSVYAQTELGADDAQTRFGADDAQTELGSYCEGVSDFGADDDDAQTAVAAASANSLSPWPRFRLCPETEAALQQTDRQDQTSPMNAGRYHTNLRHGMKRKGVQWRDYKHYDPQATHNLLITHMEVGVETEPHEFAQSIRNTGEAVAIINLTSPARA